MQFRQILLSISCMMLALSPVLATVDSLTIFSSAMKKHISNIVIMPSTYEDSNHSYPTLYLLHGAAGDHLNWINRVPEIEAMAETYQIIIVCPDGGKTSWYFDSPIDPDSQYETYMSSELIKAVDEKYRTISHKDGRAITGLSMGGHGALYLAFRHQDVWSAAGSMSGGVDLLPFTDRWSITQRLGNIETHRENWESNSVINLTDLLKGSDLKIMIDCGVDDFFYQVNKNLHEKLMEQEVLHEFIIRPGGHSWEYWSNAIEFQLLFFNNHFEQMRLSSEHRMK